MKYGSIILEKREYVQLKRLMNLSGPQKNLIEKSAVKKLTEELLTALICDEQEMPVDVVRFNRKVTVQSGDWKKTLQLVVPSESDAKMGKISIMSPMGMGLIGYSMGDRLNWEFPSGVKELLIETVEDSDTPATTSILI
jgi:regulator of nucleoside diphosphate kinase